MVRTSAFSSSSASMVMVVIGAFAASPSINDFRAAAAASVFARSVSISAKGFDFAGCGWS